MSWQGILGHDGQVEQFRRMLAQGRLATTFLFIGQDGIGKWTFALRLAQSMLCGRAVEAELSPCRECADCHQVDTDSHPDLLLIRKPEDKAFIPVETLIGDRDHRMRSGLCHFMSLSPATGKRRIAILDDADFLNQEGANSLLKTLEEPSPGAVIILIGTSAQRKLPTIRSRSQIIRFQSLADTDVAHCLVQIGAAATPQEAETMAARAGGSVARAIDLSEPSLADYQREIWRELAKSNLDRAGLTSKVNQFLDSTGKDMSTKRVQLRLSLQTSIDFYRSLARALAGVDVNVDRELQSIVHDLVRGEYSIEAAVAQLERCIEGLQQVGMNANLGILVDAWACDLAIMTRTQRPITASSGRF